MKTQTGLMRERMEETKVRITEMTGISVERQNEMMFNGAFEFLESIGCVGDDQTNMASTKDFWGFWEIEWFHQDRQFITNYHLWFGNSRELSVFWYDHEHAARSTPRVEAGYHQVIKAIAKIR